MLGADQSKTGEEVPYRYEDLGDKAFQRLCGALLVHLDDQIQVPPLGQSDGGFDAFRRSAIKRVKVIGHQVKWTQNPSKIGDPVKWLAATLEGERKNLQRMSSEGTGVYLLITNVPSTSRPGVGRLDRMDEYLSRLGSELKMRFRVWWRSDLDARLDAAPSELKFEYPDMLVGADAIRALLSDALQSQAARRHARLLRAAARTALESEETIGFRQGHLDGMPLDDLFVDVTASRRYPVRDSQKPTLGLDLLLGENSPSRLTILGAPGQGKSTLIQRASQLLRRHLLDEDSAFGDRFEPRVAIKVLLREYGIWLAGNDPFALEPKKRPRGSTDSIESFVAHVLKRDSGGQACTVDDVAEIGNRFPLLVALDGLDEIADVQTRAAAVREIGAFEARCREWLANPRIVVTSRPSFDRLPEPSSDIFINFNLDQMGPALRLEYLTNWTRANKLSDERRREIQRIFVSRSSEEHVLELATNPMQLTILLYLINQRGDSVPQRRTELYTNYLQLFLDREASNSSVVMLHRDLLEGVTAFLGWHLQSLAESENSTGRAPRKELIRVMKHFLVDNGQDVALVDELFTAVSTRVWALVSRVEGTFEFDVQSMREYFAAKYIFDRAPAGQASSGIFARFTETAARPYWANTARFMAGLFRYGEKAQLADDLISEISEGYLRFWPRRFALTLLRDGIFDDQPKPRRRLLEACMDRLGVRLALRDLESGTGSRILSHRGGDDVVALLRDAIEASPMDELAIERARLLREYATAESNCKWWSDAITGSRGRERWLELAAALRLGTALTPAGLAHFRDDSELDVRWLLRAGAEPPPGSALDRAMIRCVLNGVATSGSVQGNSTAAAIARAFDPRLVSERTPDRHRMDRDMAMLDEPARPTGWPSGATAVVRERMHEAGQKLVAARQRKAGQAGTTSWIAGLSDAIAAEFGACWLSYEIAIVGASAMDLRTGHSAPREALAFGRASVPSALIRDVRTHVDDVEWWLQASAPLTEEVDIASWILAAVACRTSPLRHLLARIAELWDMLPAFRQDAIWSAVEMISKQDGVRTVRLSFVQKAAQRELALGSLLGLLLDHGESFTPSGEAVAAVTEGAARDDLTERVWRTVVDGNAQRQATDLVCASRSGLRLSQPGSTAVPTAYLRQRARPESPWSILAWLDRDSEFNSQRAPLGQFALDSGWFEPAE